MTGIPEAFTDNDWESGEDRRSIKDYGCIPKCAAPPAIASKPGLPWH